MSHRLRERFIDDVQLSDEVRISKEVRMRQIMREEELGVAVPSETLNRFLEQIDLSHLHSFYESIFLRAGLDAAEVNIVPKEDVFNIERGKSIYRATANAIVISESQVRAFAKRMNIPQSLEYAHILLHEQAHANSAGVICRWGDGRSMEIGGLSVGMRPPGDKKAEEMILIAINEGMNELVARDSLLSLLNQSSAFADCTTNDISRFITLLEANAKGLARHLEVALVQRLMEYLSKWSGVSKGTVYGAFLHARLRNNRQEDDLLSFLREAIGEDLTRALAHLSTGLGLRIVSGRLNDILDQPPAEAKTHLLRWLGKVHDAAFRGSSYPFTIRSGVQPAVDGA